MPGGAEMPSEVEMPGRAEMPGGAEMPGVAEMPSRAEMPSGMEMPSSSEMPSRAEIPSVAEPMDATEASHEAALPAGLDQLIPIQPARAHIPNSPTRSTMDHLVTEAGAEPAMKALINLKVTELRTLAREYPELNISGREISKANKTQLLRELKTFYEDRFSQ